MDQNERSLPSSGSSGLVLVPIHRPLPEAPLTLCAFYRQGSEPGQGGFVLLREVPGSRVYLGGVCDAAGRVQQALEIWVQEPALEDATLATHQAPLDNASFDQRWWMEFERTRSTLPETVLIIGMEEKNPSPILVKQLPSSDGSPFAQVEPAPWRLCQDDALLRSAGLPAYTGSSHRYLYNPASPGQTTLLALTKDAPLNNKVQGAEHLLEASGVAAVFNPHAGLVRATRYSPLELENYLQVLEGRPWPAPESASEPMLAGTVYDALRVWSTSRTGSSFLFHPNGSSAGRYYEVFFLKSAALRELFRAARDYVKAHQLPFLNLTPASFRVSLTEVGSQFPALWTARTALARPGQSQPLDLRIADQKYFVRVGKAEPSPFLPEGLGAHSFGIGSVRIRNVTVQPEGVVLEGTLVAEDYLGLSPNDLLWFKLPLGEERLQFFAQVYTSEIVGPKEGRFRTVPAQHSDKVVAALKRSVGTAFQRSPYEIWPLLSSPCDLFSLGVIATRLLLANSSSSLPIILDEVLSLAQHFSKDSTSTESVLAELKRLVAKDQRNLDLISPHALFESGDSPEQARAKVPWELWLNSIALLLRLFPGFGPQSYCHSLGDVRPDALETVFEPALRELDTLVSRMRGLLIPSPAADQEIASIILDELKTA
jgi:hypothetical protein